MKSFTTPIIVVLLLASVIANCVMYAKYRSRRPILTVNGDSVTKKDMQDYLEQNFSPEYKALQTKRLLISQAAKKKNLSATEAEITENYNEQKELDWELVQRIRNKPWIADDERNNVRFKIEASRLLVSRLMDKVPITTDEILEEYNRNPAQYDTPNKARVELAVLLSVAHVNEIVKLMQKDPPVSPKVIMQNFPSDVAFLGDNYQFTVVQGFGTTERAEVFRMKPGEVKGMGADPNLARIGAKGMIIRMAKIEPGHKNDPIKDPKTQEKIKFVVAARRENFKQLLQDLWDKAQIVSEDPIDKKRIEQALFPDPAR